MKNTLVVRRVISYLLPVVIIGYILFKINLQDLRYVLGSISIKWYLFGFIIYSLNQVMRTIRFSVLIPEKTLNPYRLFQIQALYIFYNYILPFKTGELSYLVFIRKYSKASMAEGVTSLFVSRIFDVLVLILFWFGLYAVKDSVIVNLPEIQNPVKPLTIILLILFAFFLLLLVVLPKLFKKNRENPNIFRSFLMQLVENFKSIHNIKTYVIIILLSFLMYGSIFWSFGIIVRSMGHSIGFWQTVTISLFALLGRTIQGVGNFGSHEAAWTGALFLIGFSQKEAFLMALSSHFIIISYILILTAFSYVGLKIPFNLIKE